MLSVYLFNILVNGRLIIYRSHYYEWMRPNNCILRTKRSITDCYRIKSPSYAQIKMPSPWFLFRFGPTISSLFIVFDYILLLFFSRNLHHHRTRVLHTNMFAGYARMNKEIKWIQIFGVFSSIYSAYELMRLYAGRFVGQQEIMSWRCVFQWI